MELAYREGRILLTEDKDFGWLTFVAHIENPGVLLIRFPATARAILADSVARLVADLANQTRRLVHCAQPWFRPDFYNTAELAIRPLVYSYRHASNGSSFVARRAGT